MSAEFFTFVDRVLTLLKDIIVVACPVIIAIVGYRSNKKEKSDKKYREVRAELDKKERDERAARDERIDKTMNDLSAQIKQVDAKVAAVNKKVDTVQESVNIKEVEKQLSNLIKINGAGLNYSQSLSRVVVKMADGIVSSSICDDKKDSIMKAIEEHQDEEKKITQEYYSILY